MFHIFKIQLQHISCLYILHFRKTWLRQQTKRHICFKIFSLRGFCSEGTHTFCYYFYGNAKSVNRNIFQSTRLLPKNKNILCRNLTCDGVDEQDGVMEGYWMSYFSSIFINIMSCKQIISSLPNIPAAFDQSLFQVFNRNHVRVKDAL